MERTIRRYRSDWELSQCGQFKNGLYCSRWYQGLYAGMEWLRLSLKASGPIQVRVYAADETADGLPDGLEPALERSESDLLLYGVKGQFVCFTVEPGEALASFELEFPGLSIDSLLPSVMQGDETLKKLLGVYQSLYMDLNRELAGFPARLDPKGRAPLPDLCHWLGAASWMEADLPEQELLAHAVELNRRRGTKKGLQLLAKLVTGQSCEIVEPFQWNSQPYCAQELDDCARLYGTEQAHITILFPVETSEEALSRLKAVLDDFIPLGVSCTVVRWEKNAALDGYSCLDSGVQTAEPPPAELDGPEDAELILE